MERCIKGERKCKDATIAIIYYKNTSVTFWYTVYWKWHILTCRLEGLQNLYSFQSVLDSASSSPFFWRLVPQIRALAFKLERSFKFSVAWIWSPSLQVHFVGLQSFLKWSTLPLVVLVVVYLAINYQIIYQIFGYVTNN